MTEALATAPTIMVVDDTVANLTLLGDLLRGEGYRVVQFPRGPMALEAARAQAPDLILLDIMMPEMDGFEVCRELKADPHLAHIPVLFISALGEVDPKVEAFAAGGVDYITKPFERAEILARTRTQLELLDARRRLEQQRSNLETQVRERTAHLTRAQRMARVGSWTIDLDSNELHWFDDSWRLMGLTQGGPVTLERLLQQVHPDDRKRLMAAWEQALASGRGDDYNLSYRVLAGDEVCWVKEWIEFEHDDHGAVVAATGSIQDITDQVRVEQALRTERRRLRNALDAARAGSWEWNAEHRTLNADRAWAELLGYRPEELDPVGIETWEGLVHPDDLERVRDSLRRHVQGQQPVHQVEYRIRHRDGHWVWLRTSGRTIEYDDQGGPRLVAGIDVDVSAQKTRQLERERLARLDPLTGLPNRIGLAEQLTEAIRNAGNADQTDSRLAVAYIDLDGLGVANLRFGREGGDQIILETARRISDMAAPDTIVTRIGGDEFVLVLSISGAENAGDRIRRLIRQLGRPIVLDSGRVRLTASAGLTLLSTTEREDEEQLVRQAFQALYEAKLKGKNRLELFDKDREQNLRQRYERLDAIRAGLDRDQFILHYQPKVHLRSGDVLGFEALIRWQHPEQGLVPPGEFIPALTNQPLAVDVGDWVIERALKQLAQWNDDGFETCISVNVDGQQLLDPDFAERLAGQLAAHPGVRPHQLELEMLETSAMEDIEQVADLIGRFQQMGISVSLDDYGTGYSSLTFVKRLPVSTIKIDQSFVRDLLIDSEHEAIIGGIVTLAEKLQRKVIAEGVETEQHGRRLIELGCQTGQGYGIARPMPAGDVRAWLAQWQVPASWREAP